MLPFLKLTVQASKNTRILKNHTFIRQINGSSVSEFYNGKSVFLTGGTGFLGQVIVEKLLYGCEGLDKLYILVRQKKGQPVETRVQELVKNPLFNRIKETKPHALSKLVPVNGDISEPHLGIKPEDEDILKDKVSVVIHSAASVRFNDPLSVIMNLNFEGTRRVIELCQRMKKIDVFAHISTAFTQTNIAVLEEKVYPPAKSYEEVYKFIEEHGDNAEKTTEFIGKQPNTYAFTKGITENYVGTQTTNIPTIILRPSVVGPIYKDGQQGWLHNWATVLGTMYDSAKGYNRYVLTKKENVLDFIPVDYFSNLIIVAAAKGRRPGTVPVYNSTSGDCNPTTWWSLYKYFVEQSIENKHFEKYPSLEAVSSLSEMQVKSLLTQEIPAYLEDALLRLENKKPRHLDTLKRVISVRDGYTFFTSHNWVFKSDEARGLKALLSEEDRKLFPFDPTDINWPEYFKICYDGVTKYLAKL